MSNNEVGEELNTDLCLSSQKKIQKKLPENQECSTNVEIKELGCN